MSEANERSGPAWRDPATWRRAAITVAVVLVAFDALALFAGDAPREALARALSGTWGTAYGIGQVLYKATPLLLTGVGFQVALRAGLFNIGAEGQLLLGSLAAGAVASRLPAATPWPLGVVVALGAAAAAGGGYGLIAGGMKTRFGAHEVITTILLNRIAESLTPFVLQHLPGGSGYRTPDATPSALLPRLDRLLPSLSGSAVSVAAPLALLVCAAVVRWQERSVVGRELGWLGQGADVCRAQGIAVERRLLLAMGLSGSLAALGSAATVLGYKGYFELGLGAGAGFSGIAVAMLGQGRTLGMVAAALLLGTLQQAGLVLNASLPKESMDVLTAVVIVAAAAGRGRP